MHRIRSRSNEKGTRMRAKVVAGALSAALAVGGLTAVSTPPAGAAVGVGYNAYALFDFSGDGTPDFAAHVRATGPLYTLTATRWVNGQPSCEGSIALKVGEFTPNPLLASARLVMSRTFPCAEGATSLSVQWVATRPLELATPSLCRSASATSSVSSGSSDYGWMCLGAG